jgi:hypothetical protein
MYPLRGDGLLRYYLLPILYDRRDLLGSIPHDVFPAILVE